jgi:alkylhydroperoxidase family enzyme
VFAALRAHFNEREIVELTANIAGYNMVSRFMEALELLPDERAIATRE